MNKDLFRLVFSQPLGFLVPVAEITRSQRKSGQPETASALAPTHARPELSLTRLAIAVLLAGEPSWAAAELLVDLNRPSGTTVVSAPNGVPVIEIANPNGNGLSHNRFTEFDVQKPGAVFNNSLDNGQSQLGGAVLLNPNLQREATAILTEVTGNGPSSINGTLEVFGGKADLLIAKLTAKGGQSARTYKDFVHTTAAIEEAYSATAGALKVAAHAGTSVHPGDAIPMYGPWHPVTPVRSTQQEAYRQAADTLYNELDREQLPFHRYTLATHSGFKRLLDSDIGGTKTVTVSTQKALGLHTFNGLNETVVTDATAAQNTPAVPMQTTSSTGAGITGGSKGILDRAHQYQKQTTRVPFDYSDPGQSGITTVVKAWQKAPNYLAHPFAFARAWKDDSSTLQVAIRKVLIGSSAENQVGSQTKHQTYAQRAFLAYTAPGKQFSGTEQAGLGVKVPLPVPGLSFSLSGNAASANTTTLLDPHKFTYGNDMGARAIVTTKLQNDLLGHKVTNTSIKADSQRFIEILGNDPAQKSTFLGDSRYDVISSTLSQYRNALLLNKDGNFDHPVISPALGLLKTPVQQQASYDALHTSKGEARAPYSSLDSYIDKAGFMGYMNAHVGSNLNKLMATTWREKTEGMELPLLTDVDALLANKQADGLTRQQYLKRASSDQRLAFYQDTAEGKQMVQDFLKISDFAAHQNDFVFTHNSYKYRIDPQVRERQARLFTTKPQR